MANYSRKKNTFAWIVTFVAILMLAVAVTAAITQGFKDWNPWGWFDKEQVEEDPAITDEEGNALDNEAVHKMPSAMVYRPSTYGLTPATSVTIKAVIEPADATNQLVDWTIYFANGSSTWANGKDVNDYVSITDTDSLTNTVTFKEAFGEQIIIKVTSQDNTDYSATCTVDCAQKLQSTYVTYAAGSELSGDAAVVMNNVGGQLNNWAMLKMYLDTSVQKAASFTHNTTSVYTIEDEYTTTVSIAPSAELLAAAKAIDASATSGTYDASKGITPNSDFFAQLLGESFATVSNLYELGKVLDAKSVAQPFVVTVTTTSTYSNDVVNTYYMAYTANSVGKPVTGITIENGTIIF